MKKFILLLTLISLFNFSYAQQDSVAVDFNPPKNKLHIDNRLIPYVEEFIDEGKKRGFYLRGYMIEKFDFIMVADSLPANPGQIGEKIGQVGFGGRGFYINKIILSDTIQTKITVFHEIGHIVKGNGNHICGQCYNIMSAYAPRDLSPYTD